MKKYLLIALALILPQIQLLADNAHSPNGKLNVTIDKQTMTLNYEKRPVMKIQIGMDSTKLAKSATFVGHIKADYTMLAGKRLHCNNEANEYRLGDMTIRLYNDGLAFRYNVNGLKNATVPTEHTAYIIPEGKKRWMQQWTDANESFYPLSTTYKTKPDRKVYGVQTNAEGYNIQWAYPSLIEHQAGVFTLISEANIERQQSASTLFSEGEKFKVVPSENNEKISGNWHTPWRVVITGHLKDIVESTLITDLSNPSKFQDKSWIQPGVASWVYWAYNHGSNDYNIIKKYVDMAATLKLPYVLIDAEWDTMKDGKTVEDAINYAHSKNVKPMIWYNSSIGWVDGAPTPKYKLNTPADREKEFSWLEKIGVAGVKIDFFSGESQVNMDLCLELLECAAKHHLLINFHGATVPRGWQRTYPNLLTTEAVYGEEWYNNVATFTDVAAKHNATLLFTRNVIGPMDYTPCAFSDSQHPHITSNAHELALTVLYESGLQHLADKPESYFAQPKEVQHFFTELPVAWDETHYISGYPGESAILARRSGKTWYVAGINGTDEVRTIPLSLARLNIDGAASIKGYMDNTDSKHPWNIRSFAALPEAVTMQPRGGFVLKITMK